MRGSCRAWLLGGAGQDRVQVAPVPHQPRPQLCTQQQAGTQGCTQVKQDHRGGQCIDARGAPVGVGVGGGSQCRGGAHLWCCWPCCSSTEPTQGLCTAGRELCVCTNACQDSVLALGRLLAPLACGQLANGRSRSSGMLVRRHAAQLCVRTVAAVTAVPSLGFTIARMVMLRAL